MTLAADVLTPSRDRLPTSVVTGRLGENYLTAVSTIHAFCWELIKGFDEDIREALLARQAKKLADAKAYAAGKVKGESDKDREKYAEIEAEVDYNQAGLDT